MIPLNSKIEKRICKTIQFLFPDENFSRESTRPSTSSKSTRPHHPFIRRLSLEEYSISDLKSNEIETPMNLKI